MERNNENLARIQNLADGPRDYPLRNGASLYLAARGKTSGTEYISPDEISEPMLAAERKGLIRITRPTVEPASETTKEAE